MDGAEGRAGDGGILEEEENKPREHRNQAESSTINHLIATHFAFRAFTMVSLNFDSEVEPIIIILV